jgi:hypothetical protein
MTTILFLLMSLLQPTSSFAKSSLEAIYKKCIAENGGSKAGKEICDCHIKAIKNFEVPVLEMLAKEAKGLSVKKELETIEGASVFFDFDEDVKKECKKNPKYVHIPTPIDPEDLPASERPKKK